MSSTQVKSAGNSLLNSLSKKEQHRFMAHCELVQLNLADVISHVGDPIQHVYFPLDSIISLVNPVDGNAGMEVALIGNEGMLGITLMLGSDVTPIKALVQSEGTVLRIASQAFLTELELLPALRLQIMRYICVSFSQLVQTTVCNRFHVVEERLARLLLMIRDRKHSGQFYITQELLAQMLGVRRVGVTKAASSLQLRKLISYTRGDMKINDIAGLENASCICYQTDKNIYKQILHTKNMFEIN
ncbi:MAG: Crp/Fnr family transcriptional regulator [Methylotenera sp.]